jgi:hypothetical protein
VTAPVVPHLAGAVRAFLLGDASFAALVPGGLLTAAPTDVTKPFAVMLTSATPLSADAGAWRGTIALNGCATIPSGTTQPLTVAWDIAATAAALFARARNVVYQTIVYSARVTDGPMEMPLDKSRGDAAPVYGVQVRAELTIHAH